MKRRFWMAVYRVLYRIEMRLYGACVWVAARMGLRIETTCTLERTGDNS